MIVIHCMNTLYFLPSLLKLNHFPLSYWNTLTSENAEILHNILQEILNLVLQFSAAASEPGQLCGLSALEMKMLKPLLKWLCPTDMGMESTTKHTGFCDFLKLKWHEV